MDGIGMEQTKQPTSEELRMRQTKLVEALESGTYAQGIGQLRNANVLDENGAPAPDSYCCLGVACDVYLRETGEGRWDDWAFELGVENENAWLPVTVAKWFGFSNATGNLVGENRSLMGMNDEGIPFPEIAKTIRSAMDDPATQLFAEFRGQL